MTENPWTVSLHDHVVDALDIWMLGLELGGGPA
jgi:hypothetical protein